MRLLYKDFESPKPLFVFEPSLAPGFGMDIIAYICAEGCRKRAAEYGPPHLLLRIMLIWKPNRADNLPSYADATNMQ